MSFICRAIFFGENSGYFSILKEFLYRMGLRETQIVREAEEIVQLLKTNVWPIVFVDSQEHNIFDSFCRFDSLYSRMGFELIPYVLVANLDDRRYPLHAVNAGARGFIKKPLQPTEAAPFIKELIPKPNDVWTENALVASVQMLLGNYEQARPSLLQLTAYLPYQRAAEISLLRCETLKGEFSKAEDRVGRLIKKYPNNLRILYEIADYFYRSNQLLNAGKFLKATNQIPVIINRFWQNINIYLENDELDAAALLIAELFRNPAFKEISTEVTARMMLSMGLGEYVQSLVSLYPNLTKAFHGFKYKREASMRATQEKAATST